MTDTVVAEGQVKFRDGKKWRTRWVVVRKPSPVADCLSVLVYKEKKKGKEKGTGNKERLSVTLEVICGVELAAGYDGVCFSLSILSLAHTLVLGFHSRDALLAWDARIRHSLGEVHRFGVRVEPGTKLESGPASLHLCNNLLALTRGVPPLVVGHWKLSALRRYGAVPNGFVFEGGTRCGYWAGVFFLSCSEGEHVSFLFDCITRGITPTRVPHGLRPVLPADPSADPASAEERIMQETSELEKRLSILSHCSLASSSASTYSCSTSVAGDDHSSISSSSSSQSDASYGSRLPFWPEPLAKLHLSTETASSSSTLRALTGSDERLYAAVVGGSGTSSGTSSATARPPRGLHDSGRQSSLDSGIGTAAGSQSSCSGSFSSCTGSLDMTSPGAGGEFGSVASLPPLSSPPPPPPQSILITQNSSATSSRPGAPWCRSQASQRHSDEYQNPALLCVRYDTPRSLIGELSANRGPAQLGDGVGGQTRRQAVMQRSLSWGSEVAPDPRLRSTPQVAGTPPGGLMDGETQVHPGADNYITPEQWWLVRSRCFMQVGSPPSGPPPSADSPGVFQPRSESSPSVPADADNSGHYVRGPLSSLQARSNRELLCTEPDLQEPSSAPVCSPGWAEDGSIRYAHLSVTTMETAQRVGAAHVEGREDRPTTLTSPQFHQRSEIHEVHSAK